MFAQRQHPIQFNANVRNAMFDIMLNSIEDVVKGYEEPTKVSVCALDRVSKTVNCIFTVEYFLR